MGIRLLDGWARKVSVPLVALAIPGWLVFVVGFALFNSRSDAYDELSDSELYGDLYPDKVDRADVDWFPHWLFMVTGPLFFINAFIHLIVGRWFTGVFHHFLAALYLASGGAAMYRDVGEVVSDSPASMNWLFDNRIRMNETISQSDFRDTDEYGRFLFMGAIGALLSVFFVLVYMVLWAFHSDAARPGDQVVASGNAWEMKGQ